MSKFFIVLVIFTIVFIECCVGGNDEIEGDQKLKRLEEGTLKPEEHVENGPKNGLKEVGKNLMATAGKFVHFIGTKTGLIKEKPILPITKP